MQRRDLLRLPLAALPIPKAWTANNATQVFEQTFLTILEGFLRNAAATSPSWAVCDLPQGAVLPQHAARSGKNFLPVSRMLPAMAAWLAGGRQPQAIRTGDREVDLFATVRQICRTAFDPSHEDYWLEAPADRPDARQAEASLVGWALWLLGNRLLESLTPAERAAIQNWLASCARPTAPDTLPSWFSVVNQAARLALSEKWKEFSGDEGAMLTALRALEGRVETEDGWFSDSPDGRLYDYSSWWLFASHYLYWRRMVGRRYRSVTGTFDRRLKELLEGAPYLFGGNGSQPLFGRLPEYRWSVVTPMIMSYVEDEWPHRRGLLRRVARLNMEHFLASGAYDAERGKLRESLYPRNVPAVPQEETDSGTPYWCMQAFAVFLIPPDDRFWRDDEEPLPVERRDFELRLKGPGLFLYGRRDSGQVRLAPATAPPPAYAGQDSFAKFSYSSHFPHNVLRRPDRCPWDGTLVFRDPASGITSRRQAVSRGEVMDQGVLLQWRATLGRMVFEVSTEIRYYGDYEYRRHNVHAPAEAIQAGIEVLDGSYALGLDPGEFYEGENRYPWQWIRARRSGYAVFSLAVSGYDHVEPAEVFEETGRRDLNLAHPRVVVSTVRGVLRGAKSTLESVHFGSPKPPPMQRVLQESPRRASGF